MLLLAASELIEGPNETQMKGKLGRINGPWTFPLYRLVHAPMDSWDLGAIPLIKNNSKKYHLTNCAGGGITCPQYAFDHISISFSK